MMTALLTGVNRAYPYAKEEMEKMLDYIDTMYKVVQYASFNVSLHTLSLLFQVSDFANSVSDRYYISSFIIWYFTISAWLFKHIKINCICPFHVQVATLHPSTVFSWLIVKNILI
jgi:hypothetical protein